MSKSIRKNFIYNLAYQILALALPLITAPYVSRVLGANNLGIYSYTMSITTYFILFGSLGMVLYGQREIAYYQDEKRKLSSSFFEIFILRCATMAISMVIFFFIFIFNHNEYSIYYIVLLIEMAATVLDISWFFQGMEEFKKIVIRNSVIKLVSIICIFTLVKSTDDLTIYFVVNVASNLAGNLSLWFSLPKYIEKTSLKELNIQKHIKPTIALFVPQIAIQVYTVLDKTMIGTIIADKSQTGFYDQAQKIIKMLLTVVTSLGTVMIPRIANRFKKNDHKKVSEYIEKSFRMVFLMSTPMLVGIFTCSNRFVPLFFGPGFDEVSILMKIISPILVLVGISGIIGSQYLVAAKRQKELTISVAIGAAINFVINLLLIPSLGALGASIGTVVAEFSVTFSECLFTRKNFNYKKMFSMVTPYAIAGLCMLVVCSLLSFLPLNNIIVLTIQAVLGVLTYFSILLIMKESLTIVTIKSIQSKIKLKTSIKT